MLEKTEVENAGKGDFFHIIIYFAFISISFFSEGVFEMKEK